MFGRQIIGLLGILLGGLMVVLSINEILKYINKKYIKKYKVTIGTIVSHKPRGMTKEDLKAVKNNRIGSELLRYIDEKTIVNEKDYSLQASIYKYTSNGNEYFISDEIYLKYPKKIGKTAKVLYCDCNPSEAVFNSIIKYLIGLLTGALFLILGILSFM